MGYNMATSEVAAGWQENIASLYAEISSLLTQFWGSNPKDFTAKDYLTMIGLGVTAVKSLYMAWQIYNATKLYGVARFLKPNLVEKYGSWALICGAGQGLGEAYMTELASCGLNLVLVTSSP